MANARLLGVAGYPSAPAPGAPQLVALAGGGRGDGLLVDAARTPQLWRRLAAGPPLAAFAATSLARALLAADQALPPRWASLEIGYALLHAGGVVTPSVADVAQQLELPPPPELVEDPVQLLARASFAHAAARCQAEALVARGAAAVSRLEAAALAPIARLEHVGLRLDVVRLRARLAEERAEAAALAARLGQALGLAPEALAQPTPGVLQALRRAGHAPAAWNVEALIRGLRTLAPERAAAALMRHAELHRLAGAFGDGLLGHLDPRDGRVHATFVQLGAQTGRMACRSPNLQGISKAFGRRACFVPATGARFVLADYAACELRILAEVSGDDAYLAAFARGDDVHAQVAETMFRTRVNRELRPELREAAKMLSFGLVYGMQPAGLAARLGCGRGEAEALTETFFAAYPTVRAYLADSEACALRRGFAETLAGRRLRLPDVAGAPKAVAAAAGRLARNMPIQGTGADIIKLALARTQRALQTGAPDARVVHCVHDALVVECPAPQAEAVARTVGEAMRAAGAALLRRVRLEATLEVADHWR